MMPQNSSHARDQAPRLPGGSFLSHSSVTMSEILREAARNRKLPREIVDGVFEKDFGVVSRGTAPEIARNFSMRLSLLQEALGIAEQRLERAKSRSELHDLRSRLADEILAMPSRILEIRDPLAILRALHKVPEVRVAPEFVSAVLGVRDERIGGDVCRYSREELTTQYVRGGFMYQPSEIVDIWPIFEHLSFVPGSVFYDLGSGYGHAVFYGAALRPDVTFKGIELMSMRVEECQSVAARLGTRNVTFAVGDLAKGGFTDADIIFLFNPFSPDTEGEVQRHMAQLAEEKPLVVLDYRGLVTEDVSTLRQVSLMAVAPYRLMVSRRFDRGSRALVGI